MNSRRTPNAQKLKTDIVIIGGGGAGLAAAVAAAEKGAKVILLEKRRNLGGNTAMAEGFFAAESPAQKRMMIDAPRDKLFQIAMDYAHWKINPRIIRAFVDKSGDTVRWLEEKGLRFDWVPPLYPNQAIRTWHVPKEGEISIIKALSKNCEELGVQIFCKTAVKKILTDKRGSVVGVVALSGDKELEVTAKSVIIATGGYGGNKKLLKKYCPYYSEDMRCFGLPLMGDGLSMATEIGAATEGLGIIQQGWVYFRWSEHLSAVAGEPNMISVNKRGERFTDETLFFHFAEYQNALIRQPGKVYYALFDDRIKQNIIDEGLLKGVGVLFVPQRTKLTDLEKKLRLEAEKGRVKISDSWDEIARWIGATPEVLRATIDEYNSSCEHGYDEIFAKDRRYLEALRNPPYYAIRCGIDFPGTIGGIKINHHMEVLDTQDNPILGLYAAGSETGGWEDDTYCAILAGSTSGFALNSGRIAGENAAQYSGEPS